MKIGFSIGQLLVSNFISDKILAALGLQRSKLFLKRTKYGFPQIVFPILDLIGKDPKWSKFGLTLHILLLLSCALEVNSTLKGQFNPCFTQNQDIVTGLQNYFSWSNLNHQEFTENEDLLLQILSNYLERKIIFHPVWKPIYPGQEGKTFGESFDAVFRIFGYRYHGFSYYIIATKSLIE